MNYMGMALYNYDSEYRTYVGAWENGAKNGEGTMKYTNGDTYSGSWVDDKFHG